MKKEMDSIHIKKDYTNAIHFNNDLSKKKFLLTIDNGSITRGLQFQLFYPDIAIKPQDKIAIVGTNGSGKSTFLAHLYDQLTFPEDKIVYIPQEISQDASKNHLKEVKALSNEVLGELLIIISRLGSDPKQLLSSVDPSPGEVRKLMLALGIVNEPYIILMDEPTNHLDLPSIECVENALIECNSSIILVSHDREFLKNITQLSWHFEKRSQFDNIYEINIR